MTNRQFIRQLCEVPRVNDPELDFEFLFRAGENRANEMEHEGAGISPWDVTPDWDEWLDREVGEDVVEWFKERNKDG